MRRREAKQERKEKERKERDWKLAGVQSFGWRPAERTEVEYVAVSITERQRREYNSPTPKNEAVTNSVGTSKVSKHQKYQRRHHPSKCNFVRESREYMSGAAWRKEHAELGRDDQKNVASTKASE